MVRHSGPSSAARAGGSYKHGGSSNTGEGVSEGSSRWSNRAKLGISGADRSAKVMIGAGGKRSRRAVIRRTLNKRSTSAHYRPYQNHRAFHEYLHGIEDRICFRKRVSLLTAHRVVTASFVGVVSKQIPIGQNLNSPPSAGVTRRSRRRLAGPHFREGSPAMVSEGATN